MSSFPRRLQEELESLRQAGHYRQLAVTEGCEGRLIRVGQRELVNFAGNNYLGLTHHPRVIDAAQQAIADWGTGSQASRLICGTQQPHRQLEQLLAQWLGKPRALVFPTGYMTNAAVLTAVPEADDLILIDKLCHASIIDGASASKARLRSYRHGDLARAEQLLARGGYRRAFLVTDSLFSMDGDTAPLAELVALKHRYDALLLVDEAHAIGCLGPDGRGLAAERGLLDEVDIVIGTLSKAMGSLGGFVACSEIIAEWLINKARSFIFTTALPAGNCAAALAALTIIADEPHRRRTLQQRAELFRRLCRESDWAGPLPNGLSEWADHHIVPIQLGDAARVMTVAGELARRGYLLGAVRPPTVPPATSRLRVSLMSEHTEDDIRGLVHAIGEAMSD